MDAEYFCHAERFLALLFPPHYRQFNAPEQMLGAHVQWTHRAAVARWSSRYSCWALTEGVFKHERPQMSTLRPEPEPGVVVEWVDPDPFYSRKTSTVNKTVFVWPEDGRGVVVGLTRRAVGISEAPSGPTNNPIQGYDPGEPGYFVTHGYVPVYAVRTTLRGTQHMLVPTWALRRV